VRKVADVAVGPDFAIRTVTCRDDHTGWSPSVVRDGYNLVLPRSGRFRRRADGDSTEIDPTLAYVGVPDTEENFAHPAGGDVCTWINLAPRRWLELTGDVPRRKSTFYVDARLDLVHRRMRIAAASDDLGYAFAQELLTALGEILGQISEARTPADVRPNDGDRALVAASREAILSRHTAARALLPLASALGVSPFRLSRAFSREMGVSMAHYRNRVRVAQALDRLELGEESLAGLAADLGFADQAHLTRTVRQHLHHTPTALRRLLHPGQIRG
jgi:AraC-like DNA-binding protein